MTTAGVLTMLFGIFGVLASFVVGGLVAVLGLVIDALAGSTGDGPPEQGVTPVLVVAAVVVVAVGVLLSGLHVLLGVRVMRGGAVARVVLTIWDALLALAGVAVVVLTLVAALDGGGSVELVVLPLLGAAVPVAVVVCLWVPAASAWFAAGLRP
ncbi:hypothetical protein MJ876_00920 [Nocardioides sp. CFH 31398]|nr:hypothetical protein [Nocardioides sp. CFH 31398]